MGEYRMACETAGNVGNLESGDLIPIEYIEGLAFARLGEVLIPGEDEEETEAFRKRYFASLDSQAFGGNIRDYIDKTIALPGVGGVKVYPVWDGGGTVRLVIIDAQHQAPSDTLVDEVQTALDPEQNQGVGMGIAPIGHVVTVEGVTNTVIDVALTLTYAEGWGWADVKGYAEAAIDEYLHELAGGWADEDAVIVRVSYIETRLLALPGIVDITGTTLNGVAGNVTLGADSIPIRGEVTANG